MSEIRLFAKIHSTKELGKGNLIIDIEVISLNDKGILPNTDFIIKAGDITKKRTTNNEGIYRNDEVFECKTIFDKIELLKNNNITNAVYYTNIKSSFNEIKDILIPDNFINNISKDIDDDEKNYERYIIWHLEEGSSFIKGQLISTIRYHYLKVKENKTIQLKAQEGGVLIKKNLGAVTEYISIKDNVRISEVVNVPVGYEIRIESSLTETIIGQYAISK